MKKITVDMVDWSIEAELEDIPVRGNLIVSGDDEYDRRMENEVIARLENGDIWAWCSVKVTGEYRGILKAREFLGGCSYADEVEFQAKGGYYEDMQAAVLERLNQMAEDLTEDL